MFKEDKTTINKTINYLIAELAHGNHPYVEGRLHLCLNKHDNFVSAVPKSYLQHGSEFSAITRLNKNFKETLNVLASANKKKVILSVDLYYPGCTWTSKGFQQDTSVIRGHTCLAVIEDNILEIIDSSYDTNAPYQYFEHKVLQGVFKNLKNIFRDLKCGDMLTSSASTFNIQKYTSTDVLCATWSHYFSYLLRRFNWNRQQLMQHIQDNKFTLLDDLFAHLERLYNEHVDEVELTPIRKTFM